MIKSFNLATTVERYKYALETIESIYDQADIIRVYLNDFNQIPKEFNRKKIYTECGPDLNCSGKFLWCHEPDQYYFTIGRHIPRQSQSSQQFAARHLQSFLLSIYLYLF